MGQTLPIYMGEVPEYQVKSGHMHIIWRDLEIVLPVSVMLAGITGAKEAIAKWQVADLDRTVLAFPAQH